MTNPLVPDDSTAPTDLDAYVRRDNERLFPPFGTGAVDA